MIVRRGFTLLASAASAAALLGAPLAASAAPTPAAITLRSSATKAPSNGRPHPMAIWNHTTENYVNIRACAAIGCAALGQAQMSDALVDHCYVVGQFIGGTTLWDYITDMRTGVWGFINESLLQNKNQSVHCSF